MRVEQWLQGLVHQCHITQEYTSLPCKPTVHWAIFQSPIERMQFYCISDGWCALDWTLGALYGQQTLSGVRNTEIAIFVQIYGLEIPDWWWPRQVATEKIIPQKVSSSLRNCVRWRSTYVPCKFLRSWIYSRYFVIFENIIGLLTTMASVTVCSSKFFICMLYIKCFLFMRFEFTTFQFHWTACTGDLGFYSHA